MRTTSLAILFVVIGACSDDHGSTRAADAADSTTGETTAPTVDVPSHEATSSPCTVTCTVAQTSTPTAAITATGIVRCPTARDLSLKVSLQWKNASDAETEWSEVLSESNGGSEATDLSATPDSGVGCPLNAQKVWRGVATATVDGTDMAPVTSETLATQCP